MNFFKLFQSKKDEKPKVETPLPPNVPLTPLTLRSWHPETTEATFDFSFGTQNVLADRYVSYSTYYWVDKKYLNRQYRFGKLKQQLEHYDLDILTFQEITPLCIKKLCLDKTKLGIEFKQNTYKESWEKVDMPVDRSKEGCCVIWKKKKFECIRKYEIEFNSVAYEEIKGVESESVKDKFLKGVCLGNHNIALLVLLKDISTNKRVLVCTVHLNFRSNDWIAQTYQLDVLFNRIDSLRKEFDYLIIAGDFNISKEFKDKAHIFISNKEYPESMKQVLLNNTNSPYFILKRNPKHNLDLVQCYNDDVKLYTHLSSTKKRIDSCDYIFVLKDTFKVKKVLKIDEDIKKFPNKDVTSDHIFLATKLQY